jgi:4-hydroxybenzoyl-CoA reductase subunit beta
MMRLPPFTYLAPRALDEAARMLADHGPNAMAVAGGTDLYPNMKRRQFEPKVLVGLRGLRNCTVSRATARRVTSVGTVLRHDRAPARRGVVPGARTRR